MSAENWVGRAIRASGTVIIGKVDRFDCRRSFSSAPAPFGTVQVICGYYRVNSHLADNVLELQLLMQTAALDRGTQVQTLCEAPNIPAPWCWLRAAVFSQIQTSFRLLLQFANNYACQCITNPLLTCLPIGSIKSTHRLFHASKTYASHV